MAVQTTGMQGLDGNIINQPRRRSRRYPVGAEIAAQGVDFRVWAPGHATVEVVLADGLEQLAATPLNDEGDGYFSTMVADARAGTLYWFRIDDGEELYADPASRFQPEGPLGPSQVIDPAFAWSDSHWRGVAIEGQVIYEMHVGAFTAAGTWRSAIDELPALASLGVTVLEMMPVADFTGDFGWGYDGVDLFAPTRLYGSPNDLRAFIDTAHAFNIAVILDVVYNHLGPVGNILCAFSTSYFTKRYKTEWGDPINFDSDQSNGVREFYISNARYWIEEFHFDGLRIDATQNIYDFDDSHEHILGAITRAAREAAGDRRVIIIAENEPQDVRLLQPPANGGFGMDAMWNDDLHHAAMVALIGRNEAYYSDYLGRPQEFVSAAKYAFLYQGQYYKWQNKPRGTSTIGLSPARFVNFLQNHDQIANTGMGQRIDRRSSPGRYRAMIAYILLLPGTPMLFMGQEFGASTPFLYFADHPPDLSELVRQGRLEFLQQFPSLMTPEMQELMPAPADRQTFERCKLDPSERERNVEAYRLHADLLRLRREDPVFRLQRDGGVDGAVLGPGAFVLRYFGESEDRLLLVNLDVDEHLDPAPEPLLAPPAGKTWAILWSSEDPDYGGSGTPAIYSADNWKLPGRACVVMRPVPVPPDTCAEAAEGEESSNG